MLASIERCLAIFIVGNVWDIACDQTWFSVVLILSGEITDSEWPSPMFVFCETVDVPQEKNLTKLAGSASPALD